MAFILMVTLGGGAAVGAVPRVFQQALPGYVYRFPRDHYSHDEYKTEWWYYTGHLRARDGSKYGYELTFFRIGMDVPDPPPSSPWSVDNVYMAHFAVSDLAHSQFVHFQRLNRPGVGTAGASQTELKVFNGNWSLRGTPQHQVLHASDRERLSNNAVGEPYAIDLVLTPVKPPVEEGENGVSQKASCRGCASHYYSFTRLATSGELTVNGRKLAVDGTSWMDHEYGSSQLASDQAGWDWFSVQLDDNSELMLYLLRQKDGSIDPHSAGTIVRADGKSKHLALGDFHVRATSNWKSASSGARYPVNWLISIPRERISVSVTPDLLNQELIKKHPHDVTYWEGSCTVNGAVGGRPVHGQAYVEMTGYATAFSADI